jgi:hypothetical protein
MGGYCLKKKKVYSITIKGHKTIKEEDLYEPLSTNKIYHMQDVDISRKYKVLKVIKYT